MIFHDEHTSITLRAFRDRRAPIPSTPRGTTMTSPEDAPEATPVPFAPPGGAPPQPGSTSGTPQSGPTQPSTTASPSPAAPQQAGGWGKPSTQVGYGQPRYGQYAPGPSAPQQGVPPHGSPLGAQTHGSPQPGSTPYGGPQYGGPQYGAPGYGAPQQAYGTPGPGWRPPAAKPGIIPLRPLSLGEIYDGAFAAIRKNPKVMLGVVALVIAVATIVPTLIAYVLSPSANQWLDDSVVTVFDGSGSGQTSAELGIDGLAGQLSQALLVGISVHLASIIATGLLIVAISRSVIGRTFTVSELWAQVRSKIVGLVVISLLPSIGILLVAGVFIGLIALLASNDAVGLVLLVSVVALVAVLVTAAWLTTRFVLTPAAYVLEGQRLRPSISRGWRLSRGSFWRLLGIYVLSSIITSIVGNLVATPGTIVASFLFPADETVHPGAVAITVFSQVVASTISTTFLSSAVALLYIDVRIRREGLDVELAAAADEV